MKSLHSISLVTLLLSTSPSSGQSFKKYIAGTYAQVGTAIHRNTDGGCILAGHTKSFGSVGNYDLYLVRTDPAGNMMWTRTFGTSGIDIGNAVVQTADSGFLALGQSMGRIYLVRTDPNGDLMWSRTYGGLTGGSGYGLAITPDGGAILVGATADNPAVSNIFAIRTNDMGDTLWTRTFDFGAETDIAHSVCAAPEGGFIIAATRMSTFYRMELLCITDDGNLVWNKEFYLYSWGVGRSVIATTDGGFMVAGSVNNDACLLKLDSAGTTQWAKTYPSSEGDYSEAYAVQQTMDGGFVVSGNQTFDDWLMRTDALGDTLWQHAYSYASPMAVTPIDNGGYALCTKSYNDLIFLRTDVGGNIPCDQLTIPTEVNEVTPNVSSPALTSGHLIGMGMPATVKGSGGVFTTECESTGLAEVGTGPHCLISPNPANDHCTVSFGTSHFEALEVMTMQGAVLRRMSTRGRSQVEVPLKDLAQGPYLIHLNGPLPQNLRLLVAR